MDNYGTRKMPLIRHWFAKRYTISPADEEIAMAAALDGFALTCLKAADADLSSKELAHRYHVSRASVDALNSGASKPYRSRRIHKNVSPARVGRPDVGSGP